ncbi:uncharacterized protein VTP21DRAFT_7096 [Calcarisporiella thermophila]|uniref:uncharacterized protein n=1 Tax=Calcarisporiella thermophila TaxID=911321 RepID=UPI00374219AA
MNTVKQENVALVSEPQPGLKVTEANYKYLEESLLCSSTPLHERFRSLFTLRNLADIKSIEIIGKGFADDSALLKHELAYVLGQIRNPHAIPILKNVLADMKEDPMVRHEAAEALGAIGNLSVLETLEHYLNDERVEVRETCELAIERIKMENSEQKEVFSISPYSSVDPAPPTTKVEKTSELRDILLNSKLPLFERYRAMFALRNKGDEESVLALAEGFGDNSALFRHEIAYVFGQMCHPASVPSLIKTLSNPDEAGMVRHEAAEALGSIGTPEVLPVLEKFRLDQERVVRESCMVALDIFEYENSDQFQYADGLTKETN